MVYCCSDWTSRDIGIPHGRRKYLFKVLHQIEQLFNIIHEALFPLVMEVENV